MLLDKSKYNSFYNKNKFNKMRKILSVFTLIAILLVGVVTTNAQSNGIRTGQTRTGSYVIMINEMTVPYDVSNNGQHVAIQGFDEGSSYYWSATSGLVPISGIVFSVSDDGKVAGTFQNNGVYTSGYWTPSTQTWTALPTNPAYPTAIFPEEYNSMGCMNNAGDVYVVKHIDAQYNMFPFKYTVANGFQAMPYGTYQGGRGNAISDDGSVVAGVLVDENGFWLPAFWVDNQLTPLEPLFGEAMAVSANGRYVAGYSEEAPAPKAFIYDRVNETMSYVPDLSGSTDGLHATCVTNDGDVFGFINSFPPFFRSAFACFRGSYLSFNDYLLMRGFTAAATWTIQAVYSVSADGNTFVGAASEGDENSFTFIITLDPLAECDGPENLTATIDEVEYSTINLSWDAPADPTGVTYDVYGSIFDSVPLATGITATQYAVTNCDLGQKSFVVKAVWPDGCVSAPSNSASVIVNPCLAVEMCNITFVLNDIYADGWNGAAIKVSTAQGMEYLVEFKEQIGTKTVELPSCSDDLTFEWVPGEWDAECSFTIYFGDSLLYTSSIEMTQEIENNEFLTYTLVCPNTTGIEVYEENNVQIYPNPADNYINIVAESINSVSIFNSLGQVVETINTNGNQVVVNTTKYNSGIYFVRVVANGTPITQKIIVR